MNNIQNCDSYINIPSSETYKSYQIMSYLNVRRCKLPSKRASISEIRVLPISMDDSQHDNCHVLRSIYCFHVCALSRKTQLDEITGGVGAWQAFFLRFHGFRVELLKVLVGIFFLFSSLLTTSEDSILKHSEVCTYYCLFCPLERTNLNRMLIRCQYVRITMTT
jgi:hypothetical protein